jgi:hypothetical protein
MAAACSSVESSCNRTHGDQLLDTWRSAVGHVAFSCGTRGDQLLGTRQPAVYLVTLKSAISSLLIGLSCNQTHVRQLMWDEQHTWQSAVCPSPHQLSLAEIRNPRTDVFCQKLAGNCQLTDLRRRNIYTTKTQYRKFETNVPRKGTARLQPQFVHSGFCEWFIFCIPLVGLLFLLQGNRWTKRGNMIMHFRLLTDTWMWKLGLRRPGAAQFLSGNT